MHFRQDPERAKALFENASKDATSKYDALAKLAGNI